MNQQGPSGRQGSPPGKSKIDRWVKIGFLLAAFTVIVIVSVKMRNPTIPGWRTDLEQAIKQARLENRKIVIFFMSKPPGATDRWIQDNILNKKNNRNAISEGNYLAVTTQLSPALDSELAKRYKITKLPTLLLLDPEGRELNRREKTVGEVEFRNGFLDCKVVHRPGR